MKLTFLYMLLVSIVSKVFFLLESKEREKRGVTLKQVWGKSPKAYKGICVPEMPNFFVMFGPNTINNRVFMSECAANFVSDSILKLSLSNRSSIEVRKDKYDEYNKALRAGLKERTFGVTSGGFYANAEGENWQLYPHSILYYNWTTSVAQEEEFYWGPRRLSLQGKVCLVTGAGRGIGRGIALQLGQAGATVYITGRTSASLEVSLLSSISIHNYNIVKLREREGQRVDSGRSLKGHL